jgi:type IV secretory pathway component VirB8
MIDPELAARLDEIAAKADAAYRAAESARKYLFWTGVVTVAVIVLPLIGLALVLPSFMNNYVGQLNAATGNTPSTTGLLNSLGI